MANQNDQKILQLKKQIEGKKKSLDKNQKFNPITNCSLELDGNRYNLQVLNKVSIIELLVKLNSYAMSAKELDLLNTYNISGYNVADWITDLQSKLSFISRKDEEAKLKAMEATLDKLLSDDKKVELEIDEIESILNS